MSQLLLTEPWSWICILIAMISLTILVLLSGVTSSYASKKSLASIILRSVCVCIALTILLGMFLILIEYIYDKATVSYGYLGGIFSILIIAFLMFLSVIIFPQQLLSMKAKKWCRSYPKFCTVDLQHISSKLNVSKCRVISPVSVDKIPIGMTTEAVLTRNILYILPGEHTIEFSISKAPSGRRRGFPIPDVQNRMEITWSFKECCCYTCQIKDHKDEVFLSKC